MSSPVLRPSLAMGGVLLCLAALTSSYAHDGGHDHDRGERPRAYAVTPLVSDGVVATPFTDPNLKNAWGVAFNPNGFVWWSTTRPASRRCTTDGACPRRSS